MAVPHTSPTDVNTTRDFIYPAVVAVLASFTSFLATFIISKINFSTEKKSKRINILDNLTSDLNSLDQIIDKLKTNIEENKIFLIKNITSGNNIIIHLRSLINELVVLSDTSLRREIIECMDSAANLFNDLFGLEKYQLDRQQELKIFNHKSAEELRSLKIKLMENGIIVDNNELPQVIFPKVNSANEETKIKVNLAQEIINGLINERILENNSFNSVLSNNDKTRVTYNVRLLDSQTKIRGVLQKFTINRNLIINGK